MNDLEQQVRASLRARAEDVEPTPALWQQVQARTARHRRWVAAGWAVGAAAAVVAAAVVVPGILDRPARTPEIFESPTGREGSPTPGPTAPTTGSVPTHVVVARDHTIELVTAAGNPVSTLVDLTAESEATISSVHVRPGSTAGDVTVAYVTRSEGEWSLWWVRSGREPVRLAAVGGPLRLDDAYAMTAVWQPGGAALAWTAVTLDGTVLHTQPWTADGPAADGEDVGTVDPALRLQDWVPGQGLTILATLDLEGVVIRGVDGGIELTPADPVGEGALIDWADGGETVAGPTYRLLAAGDGSRSAESATFQLLWTGEGDQQGEVPLPPELDGIMPPEVWLTAWGESAVVGAAGDAWLVTREGTIRPLEGQVVAADPFGAAAATPPPTAEPTPSTPAPTGGAAAGPADGYVVIRDGELALTAADGSSQPLMTWAADAEFVPAGVSVRPGSTVDDLTVVVLVAAEGEAELGWIRVRDGESSGYQPFPTQHQPSSGLDGNSVETPVWSSDGAYVGWVEDVGDVLTFRSVGWLDGPGTGDTATDNAGFTLDGLSGDAVLDQWLWSSDSVGMLTFRIRQAQGLGVASATIERQPDGALTAPTGLTVDAGTGPIDEAFTDTGVWHLEARGAGLVLTWTAPGGGFELDLPDGFDADLVLQQPPAAGPWLEPDGDGAAVLLGPAGQVWRVDTAPSITPVAEDWRAAAPVR